MALQQLKRFFQYTGPGFIVAATGVGAGDLIASSVAGARYGTLILWVALAGGVLKYVLNEGIARWQLATGNTLLEGWIRRLPVPVSIYFLLYLLLWSFVVAGALISFSGLAAHTLLPLFADEQLSIMAWGGLQSVLAAFLVLRGGYVLIEHMMKIFIGLMFVVVVASAIMVEPDWSAVLPSLILPRLPDEPGAIILLLGVIGGVGGSVTLLCYAYWLGEKQWKGPAFMKNARIDLGLAYLLTSLFGIAIIIISAGADPNQVEGYGMIVSIAGRLGEGTGDFGRWVFLIGFWGAVFSSMLGVWDGVPYLFADFIQTFRHRKKEQKEMAAISNQSVNYRLFLFYLALPPIVLQIFGKPAWIGIVYAVTGAFFMPFLAALLLYMNNQVAWVKDLRNGWLANVLLALSLLLFLALFIMQLS